MDEHRMTGRTITRRTALAGTVGGGLAAVAAVGIGRAQDEATPAPGTPQAGATPETDGAPSDGAVGTDARAETAIGWATEAIEAATADRDAVADRIEPALVNELLGQATDLRDRAQAAADEGDADAAIRLALPAAGTARGAHRLVAAQLIVAGLPSQEARASRVLAAAYDTVAEVSDEAESTDGDVSFATTIAQEIYQTAYDQFGAGAYGRAAREARVAAGQARLAAFLADPGAGVFPGGRGGRGRGFGRRGGPGHGAFGDGAFGDGAFGHGLEGERGFDRSPDDEADEPVTVPEPNF